MALAQPSATPRGAVAREQSAFPACQASMAPYSAVGFEAGAVTALAIGVSRVLGRPGARRTATVRFAHPYTVVAVALDDARAHVNSSTWSPVARAAGLLSVGRRPE